MSHKNLLLSSFACLAIAAGVASQANASMFMNVVVDPTSVAGGNVTNNGYVYNVTSANVNTKITLDVYGLVTDANPDPTMDGVVTTQGGFMLTGGELKGDVSWASWLAVNGVAAGSSNKGLPTYTTSFGGLGLGSSSTQTDSTNSAWQPVAAGGAVFNVWEAGHGSGAQNGAAAAGAPDYFVNSSGGTIAVMNNDGSGNLTLTGNTTGAIGTEVLLGKLTVSLSSYALPGLSSTASLAYLPRLGTTAIKPQQWYEGGTFISTNGSSSTVGNGPSSTNALYRANGAGLMFVFTSSNTGSNSAALSASLAISGPTTILGGGTTALTGNVSNTGASPANPLNWGSTAPGVVSLTPNSGAGLAGGASTPITGSLTALANGFGPWLVTPTFTGTDATTGTALPSVPTPLSFTILGHGTAATADGLGIPGSTYGNTMFTQTTVNTLTGLTTTMGSTATSFGIGKTTATILSGLQSTAGTITEMYRSRASNETPAGSLAAGGVTNGFLPLYSDVVNLSGVTGGSSTIYALGMTYDANELGGTAAANAAASNGFLYLGYRSTVDGKWHAATNNTLSDGNVGIGAGAVTNFQGSYATFTATPGFSLANMLGSWGVDTATDQVWGIINHDAEFAAVPEPGTIGLLIGGIAALGLAFRRRKAIKA